MSKTFKVPFMAGHRIYTLDSAGVVKVKLDLGDHAGGRFLKKLYSLLCGEMSPEWTADIPITREELEKGLNLMVDGAPIHDAFPTLSAELKVKLLDPPAISKLASAAEETPH